MRVLQHDEIISEIEIPFRSSGSTYVKFAYHESWDFAVVSVTARVTGPNSKANDLRLVFGGIATHPFRSVEAEEFLWGKTIDDMSTSAASELALGQSRPLKMNQYKIDLAKTLATRALMALAH